MTWSYLFRIISLFVSKYRDLRVRYPSKLCTVPFGFFCDKQNWQTSDRKSVRQVNSGQINWLKKFAFSWIWTCNNNHLSFEVWRLTNVAIQTCAEWKIFEVNYSHTLLIPETTQVQKVKWCMKENSFEISHSAHVWMATFVRRQTSNEIWLTLQVQIPLEVIFFS